MQTLLNWVWQAKLAWVRVWHQIFYHPSTSQISREEQLGYLIGLSTLNVYVKSGNITPSWVCQGCLHSPTIFGGKFTPALKVGNAQTLYHTKCSRTVIRQNQYLPQYRKQFRSVEAINCHVQHGGEFFGLCVGYEYCNS